MYAKKKSIDELLSEYNITEEYLKDAYENRLLSLPKIQKEKNIHFKATIRLLNHFNIKVRSISESKQTDIYKKQYIDTLHKKYGNGISNVSQIKEIKEKKIKTFINHYGVDNIRKYPPFYTWLNEHCIEKFGHKRIGFASWTTNQHSKKTKHQWETMSDDKKQKILASCLYNFTHGSSKINRLEVNFSKLLDSLKISYIRFFKIGRYISDFYLPDTNIVFELNGDFWHANPSKYKSNDILPFPGTNGVIAQDIWDKDKKKIDFIKNLGYIVCILWECQLKKDSDQILEVIKYETEKHTAC